MSLHVQVQFHTKYPLFDSQSDREFTFSYAILLNICKSPIHPYLTYVLAVWGQACKAYLNKILIL